VGVVNTIAAIAGFGNRALVVDGLVETQMIVFLLDSAKVIESAFLGSLVSVYLFF